MKYIIALVMCSLLWLSPSYDNTFLTKTYCVDLDTIIVSEPRWSALDTLEAVPVHNREQLIDHYNVAFKYVSEHTSLPVNVIYSYFIKETASDATGEWLVASSTLWTKGFNPGGMKFRNYLHSSSMKGDDDCDNPNTDIVELCDFATFDSMKEGLDAWITLFNGRRYESCKELPSKETCFCLWKHGYHTSKNWIGRYYLALEYQRIINE